MKREAHFEQKYKYGVYRTWPLFKWRYCEICGKEFRREWGWNYLGGPFFNNIGQDYYLCKQCCPTWEEAHRAACEGVHRGKRPPPPPPESGSGVQPPAKRGEE
jgi:hypothetical protein